MDLMTPDLESFQQDFVLMSLLGVVIVADAAAAVVLVVAAVDADYQLP